MLILFLIFIPSIASSQWKLLNTFSGGPQFQISSIYFLDLPGPPKIGFLGTIDTQQIWKTTDGGFTWKLTLTASYGEISCIDFKDSLTGWATAYHVGSGIPACFRTTDCGETWTPLTPSNPEYLGACLWLHYHHATKRLFLSNLHGALVSTDDGTTWTYPGINFFTSCAFSSDSIGIFSGEELSNSENSYTTDGGITWTSVIAKSLTFHPVAIKGTSTFFMLCFDNGGLCRSDDGGKTWRVIPAPDEVSWNSTLYGDLGHLYTHGRSAVYVSTDTGNSWQSLCGPPGSDIPGFYERDGYIYADDAIGVGYRLWYLNTDSLNIFTSSLHPTQSSTKGMSVLFQPVIDSSVAVDTAHFVIHCDSNLVFRSLSLPADWHILDSTSNDSLIDITIFDTSENVSAPSVTLNFQPVLTPNINSGKVWLDSANLYGKWMSCDIPAHSVAASDTVEINFTGCGDSLILAAMEGQPPFSVISIQPNPASGTITVGHSTGPLSIIDPLGRSYDVRQTGNVIDISSLPSGVYFVSDGLSRAKFVKE